MQRRKFSSVFKLEAVKLVWQVATLVPDDGDNALARFRSNRFAGLLMFCLCGRWYVSGVRVGRSLVGG